MHKSEIRRLRGQLDEARRQAEIFEQKAQNTSGIVQQHMLRRAREQRDLVFSLVQRLGVRA